MRRAWIAAWAGVAALVAASAAHAETKRVLPPGAAPIVQRAFARAAPALALKEASIAREHVDAVVCAPDARCYKVRLDDPQAGCAGAAAGPFCVRFVGEAPPPAAREALVKAFAAEAPDACWLDLTERHDPPERRDPAESRGRGGESGAGEPSVWLAWLALTVVPLAAGWVVGWAASRLRGRAFVFSRWVAAVMVAVPVLVACVISLRQLALGIWDLALVGGLFGVGAVMGAHRLTAALRTRRGALAVGSVAFALGLAEIVVRVLPPAPGVDPGELHRIFLDPHEADIAFTRFEMWNRREHAADWGAVLKDALYPDAGAGFYAEREGGTAGAGKKVLHLGDSMVFGLGVERREAFPALLEGMEPGSQHVNSGIPGLSPDAELLLMRNWVSRKPFDLVVVHLFTGNDIKEMDSAYPFCADGPLLDYESASLRARCPKPGFRLARSRLGWMLAHSPPPFALRALAGRSALAKRSALGLLALRMKVMGEHREESLAWSHLEAVLRAFRDELAAKGIPLVVDVLPLREALEARDPTITEAYATRGRMLEIAQRLGVRTLDPWSTFAEAVKRDGSEPWFSTAMVHDLHFGPKGHDLLARWLHERLGSEPVKDGR